MIRYVYDTLADEDEGKDDRCTNVGCEPFGTDLMKSASAVLVVPNYIHKFPKKRELANEWE